MGFLMFLKLVAKSSDLFAWPLITLVYPLYASIRAIEKNSLCDSKKCLTYWVICGLIMLFEFTSARLIEWLPFWPYVKLLFTVWLVAAHFEGAVYAYDHFLRPCFSVDLQTFGYWLRPKQDENGDGNSDSFLLLAKRFVQENGSEGLEKLIMDKVKCEEPKLVIQEINRVHFESNKENTERNRIETMGIVQTEYKAIAATENKPTTEAKVVVESSGVPESSTVDNIQKEWTCALCQVCASSETSLKDHLQGKKHKAMLDTIKKSNRTENRAKQSPGKSQKAEELSAKHIAAPPTTRAGRGSQSSILDQAPKKWKCGVCQFYTSKELSLQSHLQGKKHKAKEIEVSNNTASASAPMVNLSDLRCEKCKLQCNSLSMLTDHLRGKRHLEGTSL